MTFHLPRYNQVTDYVRYRAYFPSMKEGTACMWLETAEFNSGEPSPLSYAVNGQSNEWLMLFLNTRTVTIIVGGNSVNNPGDLSLWSQWSGDLQKVGFTGHALSALKNKPWRFRHFFFFISLFIYLLTKLHYGDKYSKTTEARNLKFGQMISLYTNLRT